MSPPDPAFLAFDTTAAHCAAVLLVGGAVVAERTEPMTRGHAERLMPLVADVLAEAGLSFESVGGIAVAVGPGNFTGIRIGVSAARGLAMSLGVPAVGVSALEALAFHTTGPVLALADARQGRVYAQRFMDGGPAAEPDLCALHDVEPKGAALVGFEAEALAKTHGAVAIAGPAHPPVVQIARKALSGAWKAAPRPAPLYIRAPDATPPAALARQ